MSVTLVLEDDLDISRGDLICRVKNQPTVGQDIDAMICWMSEKPWDPRSRLTLKQTTRSVRAVVKELHYRLDINTLHREEKIEKLALNEIGRVSIRTTAPLLYDDYRKNRTTGSFILIDEGSHATVAAGMINGPAT